MEAYIGQIEVFAFNFAPRGWAMCTGQLLPINQYQALFSLLGTTYGGNGIQTFALPNLQGLAAIGQGNGAGLTPRVIGETGGQANHTLLVTETPVHTHSLRVAANVTVANNLDAPAGNEVLATTEGKNKNTTFAMPMYVADAAPTQALAPAAIGTTGGQPHSNQMPYLGLNYCIALTGIFPSRN